MLGLEAEDRQSAVHTLNYIDVEVEREDTETRRERKRKREKRERDSEREPSMGTGRRPTARELLGLMLSAEADASFAAKNDLNARLTSPLSGTDKLRLKSNWKSNIELDDICSLSDATKSEASKVAVLLHDESIAMTSTNSRCEVELSVENHSTFRIVQLSFVSNARKVELYVNGEYSTTLSGVRPRNDGEADEHAGDLGLRSFVVQGTSLDPVSKLQMRFLSLHTKGQVALGDLVLEGLGKQLMVHDPGKEKAGLPSSSLAGASNAAKSSGPSTGISSNSLNSLNGASLLMFQQSVSKMAAAFEKQISGLEEKIDQLGTKLETLDRRVQDQAAMKTNINQTSEGIAAPCGNVEAKIDTLCGKIARLENAILSFER